MLCTHEKPLYIYHTLDVVSCTTYPPLPLRHRYPTVNTPPPSLPFFLPRSHAAKKGLQRLLLPPSPITSLTRKFRSRSSKSGSLEGLQALSGVDGRGDFVLTPVGGADDAHNDAAAVGDGEVSVAGSDVLDDDDSSQDSRVSGDSAVVASTDPRGAAAAAAADDGTGKQKRATKLARGLSNVARRLKKRSMGASEAMTLGRASLMMGEDSGGSASSYVRAHDLGGEGGMSYTARWGNGSTSPGQGTRYISHTGVYLYIHACTANSSQGIVGNFPADKYFGR